MKKSTSCAFFVLFTLFLYFLPTLHLFFTFPTESREMNGVRRVWLVKVLEQYPE